jgi:galactokinase
MSVASLLDIYGDDSALLAAQRARYRLALHRFTEQFGEPARTLIRTPGRINLIGEHTDYNGGFVLPVALDRDVLLAVRPRQDARIQAANVEPAYIPFSFDLAHDIPSAPPGEWSNYFRGAAQELCRRYGRNTALRGLDVLVASAPPHGVPRGSGLSSSTALTVAVALALVVCNEVEIERADLAHLCSEAEWYVGTRGGMMDQFAALLSRRGSALYLDCRPAADGTYSLEHVPIPGGVQVVLLTSGVHHDNVRGAFNQRVAECKVGVRLLQARFPSVELLRDVTPEALGLSEAEFWTAITGLLPVRATASELADLGLDAKWLGDLIADHRLGADPIFAVLPRCRHVITENARVVEGLGALRAGNVARFGGLMNAAHASMSADYGASCPEVDVLAEMVRQQEGVYGARITGAGWGGGVVALVQRGLATTWIEHVRAAYQATTGLASTAYVCRPGGGAGQVKVFCQDGQF